MNPVKFLTFHMFIKFCGVVLSCLLLSGCKAKGALQWECLHDATSIVFLDQRSANFSVDSCGFHPLHTMIIDTNRIHSLMEELIASKPFLRYPGAGHLAMLVVLGKNSEPLGILNIVNYRCVVTLDSCVKRDGVFYTEMSDDDNPLPMTAQSEAFVLFVYEYMEQHLPEELKRLEKRLESRKRNLKDLLFSIPKEK